MTASRTWGETCRDRALQWTRLGGVGVGGAHWHSHAHADKSRDDAVYSSPFSLNHIKIASVKSNISRQLWSRVWFEKKKRFQISSVLSRCVVFIFFAREVEKERKAAGGFSSRSFLKQRENSMTVPFYQDLDSTAREAKAAVLNTEGGKYFLWSRKRPHQHSRWREVTRCRRRGGGSDQRRPHHPLTRDQGGLKNVFYSRAEVKPECDRTGSLAAALPTCRQKTASKCNMYCTSSKWDLTRIAAANRDCTLTQF